MPNPANFESPVTLIAHGRSGTSLLMQVFRGHPEFEVVGESTDLIFAPWYGAERSYGIVRPTEDGGRKLTLDEVASLAVRATFLAMFPSKKPQWMHKPINMPLFRPTIPDPPPLDIPADWYWNVMKTVFPRGRFLTILRNPFDVVLSSMNYHGWPEEGCWLGLARVAHVLMSPAAPSIEAVTYDELVRRPQPVLRDLFSRLQVEFQPSVLEATERIHVPAKGREHVAPGASRVSEWNRLNPDLVSVPVEKAIAQLWARFGTTFDVPEHFVARRKTFAPTDRIMARRPAGVG
jgi:hypothetical protein